MIVSEIESSASDSGEEFDYAKEVEPWLGEKGGLFFQEYDGDDFEGYGAAIQSTDTAATQDFIDKQAEESDEVPEEGSYEGVDYQVEADDGTTVGVVDDFLVFAEDDRDLQADGRCLQGRIAGRRGGLHEHRRRRSQRQLRRRLRRYRRPDRADQRPDRPGCGAVPRQRRHRSRGGDRGRQPDPRLRPDRDRLQQRPRRREPADRRRLAAARLASRQLLRRRRLRRLRRSHRRSDRRDRRRRHPRRDPARPSSRAPSRKPASTSKRSPPRSATSASSPKATARAASPVPRCWRPRTPRKRPTPSPTSACCCAPPAPPASPRSRARPAASRSAARTSGRSRW